MRKILSYSPQRARWWPPMTLIKSFLVAVQCSCETDAQSWNKPPSTEYYLGHATRWWGSGLSSQPVHPVSADVMGKNAILRQFTGDHSPFQTVRPAFIC